MKLYVDTSAKQVTVTREPAEKMEQNRGLFVPVRVQLDPPLLHQYPGKMLERVEAVARQVGLHGASPQLA